MPKARYQVVYKQSVDKDLRKIPTDARKQIITKIKALAADPFPPESTKLRGVTDLYRIRYATYRVLYQVRDGELVVVVIKVGHRKEIYRDL